jgi:hypothetical protein
MWEYPRATPDGDQMDFTEVMELENGLIRRHRVYWDWFGVRTLTTGSHQHEIQDFVLLRSRLNDPGVAISRHPFIQQSSWNDCTDADGAGGNHVIMVTPLATRIGRRIGRRHGHRVKRRHWSQHPSEGRRNRAGTMVSGQ